jgi:hypothetical protein
VAANTLSSFFTACWTSSPHPVDSRDFQKINLYEGENMFYGKDSSLRSTATVAGRLQWASMKLAYQIEHVIYRGEQEKLIFFRNGIAAILFGVCYTTVELPRKTSSCIRKRK